MSPEGQKPNPTQEAMVVSIDAARDAAQQVAGAHDQERSFTGAKEELIKVGDRIGDPSIDVTTRGGEQRVDTRTETTSPTGIGTEIHAYAHNQFGEDRGRTIINRYNEAGDKVYEHRFKDPNTARKFNALIAKQVVQRAEVAGAQDKKVA